MQIGQHVWIALSSFSANRRGRNSTRIYDVLPDREQRAWIALNSFWANTRGTRIPDTLPDGQQRTWIALNSFSANRRGRNSTRIPGTLLDREQTLPWSHSRSVNSAPLPCRGTKCVSTSCSDPGFAVLRVGFGSGEKGHSFILLWGSFIRTGQSSNDGPLAFILPSVTVCPALFTSCCCSLRKAVFLSLCVPLAFLFIARNAVGWL